MLSGLATLLSFKVFHLNEIMNQYFSQQYNNAEFITGILSLISSYYSIIMLLLIPLFALSTRIAFRAWGHNYYEHIVMNAYILSYYTIWNSLIMYPFMFFLRNNPSAFYSVTQYSLLLIPLILVYFFKEVYEDKPFQTIILKVLSVLGMPLLGYILVIMIITLIVTLVSTGLVTG